MHAHIVPDSYVLVWVLSLQHGQHDGGTNQVEAASVGGVLHQRLVEPGPLAARQGGHVLYPSLVPSICGR